MGAPETSAIKQRSPAGARRAGREIHQIEKMRHVESSIVGVPAVPVKLGGKPLDSEFRARLEEQFHKIVRELVLAHIRRTRQKEQQKGCLFKQAALICNLEVA